MQPSISQSRSDAVENEACQLITGLDALAVMGGMYDGEKVPAMLVRWFCAKLEEHVSAILLYLDALEPEPEPNTTILESA